MDCRATLVGETRDHPATTQQPSRSHLHRQPQRLQGLDLGRPWPWPRSWHASRARERRRKEGPARLCGFGFPAQRGRHQCFVWRRAERGTGEGHSVCGRRRQPKGEELGEEVGSIQSLPWAGGWANKQKPWCILHIARRRNMADLPWFWGGWRTGRPHRRLPCARKRKSIGYQDMDRWSRMVAGGGRQAVLCPQPPRPATSSSCLPPSRLAVRLLFPAL